VNSDSKLVSYGLQAAKALRASTDRPESTLHIAGHYALVIEKMAKEIERLQKDIQLIRSPWGSHWVAALAMGASFAAGVLLTLIFQTLPVK
jgi:hypothetical protein